MNMKIGTFLLECGNDRTIHRPLSRTNVANRVTVVCAFTDLPDETIFLLVTPLLKLNVAIWVWR